MVPHFLAEASKLLFSSLELEPTLDQVTRLTVPSLADGCELVLEDRGRAEQVAFYHSDPVLTEMARAFARRYPFRPTDTEAIRRGRSVLMTEITDEVLGRFARSEEHLLFLRSMHMVSALSVPLTARDRVVGALRMVTTVPGRVLGQADLALAEELAARVAIAVDNARLFAAERQARADAERALGALKGADARLQAIIDNSSSIIYIRDREFKLTFANREYMRLYGDDPRFDPNGSDAVFQRLFDNTRRVMETKAPLHTEEIVPTADGDHTYLTVKFPLYDDDGEVREVCGMSTDITAIKRLEADLSQAQKMEALGRFAGAIAHDFSNLCLAMKRYVADEDLSGVEGCVDRAAGMTRQLLMFARKQSFESVDLHVDGAITRCEEMLARVLDRGIALDMSLEAGQAFVRADANQLEQAIMNLVVNARDAMPDGGSVRIATACVEDAGKAAVRISVTDKGTGMSEETRARLFEPFFTTKPPGRGTGFGLSIVYGFAQRSAGRVEVDTKLGEGSTFHLVLPCTEAAPKGEAHRATATTSRGDRSETVLLVEDDDDVREFVAHALRSEGYLVLDASDGAAALRIAKEYPSTIDLLLCDIVMPELSGSEVALRLLPLRPEIKILHVSGHAGDALLRYGELLPRVAFLEKPFTAESLAKKVRAVLAAPAQSV